MNRLVGKVPLLSRKLLLAFALGFLGVFVPAALNTLDMVAHGAPTTWSTSAVLAVVAGAVAAGLRASLALSPLNLVPSDRQHTLFAKTPPPPVVAATSSTAVRAVRIHLREPKTGIHVRHIPERQLDQRRRLGRHVEHDERSRPFAARDTVIPTRPVDWARYGKPFNQGDRGSCTGNAIAGVINTDPFRTARKGRLLTEKDAIRIYELATTLDSIGGQYPPDDTGSTGLAACKAAQKLGYIGGYRHAFSLNAALAALKTGAVITGVDWFEGFDTPDQDGVVAIAGQVRGGHEFEVVGYDPGHRDPLDGLVAAVQSWGPRWGLAGRFFFTARTWGDLLEQQGDVTVPLPATVPVTAAQ